MKRILSLVVALGVAALFSSAALAGADCNYHQTQASAPKTEAKDVATAQPSGKDATQVQTAEVSQPTKAATATKK